MELRLSLDVDIQFVVEKGCSSGNTDKPGESLLLEPNRLRNDPSLGPSVEYEGSTCL